MAKKYNNPEINVVTFDTENILQASSVAPKTTVGNYTNVQALDAVNAMDVFE